MYTYILNKNQQDSDSGLNFEVHNLACEHLPNPENRLPVGVFANCQDALKEAKNIYSNVRSNIDGCYYCCRPCHTG